MKNITIANWFILSIVLCVIGAISGYEFQNFFYTLGGLGLITFSIITTVRLFKLKRDDWLAYALAITSGFYLILVFSGTNSNDIGFISLVYLVFIIWSIVRLYKIEDKK